VFHRFPSAFEELSLCRWNEDLCLKSLLPFCRSVIYGPPIRQPGKFSSPTASQRFLPRSLSYGTPQCQYSRRWCFFCLLPWQNCATNFARFPHRFLLKFLSSTYQAPAEEHGLVNFLAEEIGAALRRLDCVCFRWISTWTTSPHAEILTLCPPTDLQPPLPFLLGFFLPPTSPSHYLLFLEGISLRRGNIGVPISSADARNSLFGWF